MDANTLRYQRDAARTKMKYHLNKIAEARKNGETPKSASIEKVIDYGLRWQEISDQMDGVVKPKFSKRATW